MLTPMMITWATVTVVLAGLSIYRSILVMHEDNQIFLDSAEAAFATEYASRLRRIQHVETYLKAFTVTSGALFLWIAATWFYQGLYG